MKVEELQNIAFSLGLVIKIQVRETLGLCFFKIVIAEQTDNVVKIWGEMKGWTYPVSYTHLTLPTIYSV